MSDVRVVLGTAAAQVGDLARRVHRLTVARWVAFSTFVAVLAALGTAAAALVGLQSAQYGATLSGGPIDGAMLLTGVLFVCGCLSGAVGLLSRDLWSRQVLAERERLAVLPLGRRALAVLSLVPTLLPVLVGIGVAVLAVAAFCWGLRASPLTPLSGFALGLTFSLTVGLAWTAVTRLPGLRSIRVGVLTAVTVGGAIAHAGWTIVDPARSESAPHRWSPVVRVLSVDEPFTAGQTVAALAALATAAWLTVVVGQAPAPGPRRPPSRGRHGHRRHGRTTPVAARVPLGVAATIVRQSSLASEVGVAVAVCAGAAWVAGRMDGLGRAEAAEATLLVVAAFSALPVLGLRSTLGPVSRLWLLGARSGDVRRGVVLASAAAQAVPLVAAIAVLAATSTSPGRVALLLALSTATFGLALVVSNVMRAVTDISVGRAAASAALMLPAVLALFTGAVRLDVWVLVLAASATCAAGLVVLRLTLHEDVVT